MRGEVEQVVIAERTVYVHDPDLNITRQITSGRAIPYTLVGLYRDAVASDSSPDSDPDSGSEAHKPTTEPDVDPTAAQRRATRRRRA